MTEEGAQEDPRTGDDEAGRERHRVNGEEVIAKIKELIREGNVRHVVIKNDEGRTLIEFPVSLGLAGAVFLPVWAAVGAVAAIVTRCTIEVERTTEDEEEDE
jgi:uncharacterized protein DUF4342